MAEDGAIEGFVPLPSPDAPVRKKPGRKPGWNKKPLALDKFDPAALRVPGPKSGQCEVCGGALAAMSLELVQELVRAARDRLLEQVDKPELQAAIAQSDTLYLAARLDGLCSLGCWRKKSAAG